MSDKARFDSLVLPVPVLPSMIDDRPEPVTPTRILKLIASQRAETVAGLAQEVGVSRTLIGRYVDALKEHRVITERGRHARSGRGRPGQRLGIDRRAGMIAVIDGEATSARIALVSLDQRLLAERWVDQHVDDGPESSLRRYIDAINEMIAGLSEQSPLWQVVIGLPARIDMDTALPARPTIMPRWDAFPVAEVLEAEWGAPVYVENDVNLRCLGEACWGPSEWLPILAIKVGTGIGAGLIDRFGHIFHGYRGAAGEVGHLPTMNADPDLVCTCGSVGCVEANASIRAMLIKLANIEGSGFKGGPNDLDKLLENVRHHDFLTMQVVNEAADMLGITLAGLCNILNPRRVMITCALAEVTDHYLARIRTQVYERARPLATRELIIGYSPLGSQVGLAGGIAMALDLAYEQITRSIMSESPTDQTRGCKLTDQPRGVAGVRASMRGAIPVSTAH